MIAFFSCSEGEKAYEHADLKHGVFFYYVIEALKGAAIAPDQTDIFVPDVLKYVTRGVKDFVRKNTAPGNSPNGRAPAATCCRS